MAGQSWLADIFAGIMIITAAYCVSRLVIARRQRRPTNYQVDGVHVLMGVAMAGMLVPRLRVFWAGGWEIVFAVATVWFAWLTIRERRGQDAPGRQPGHHFQHVLASGAMLYMFLAVTGIKASAGGSGMSGMGGGTAHFTTLALLLAAGLFGYVVWTADRLPGMATVTAYTASSVPVPVLAGAAARSKRSPASRPRHARGGRPGPGEERCRCTGVAAACCMLRDRHGRHHGLHADPDALRHPNARRVDADHGWLTGRRGAKSEPTSQSAQPTSSRRRHRRPPGGPDGFRRQPSAAVPPDCA